MKRVYIKETVHYKLYSNYKYINRANTEETKKLI